MNTKKAVIALVLIATAVTFFVVQKKDDKISKNSNNLRVTASFYPLAFLSEKIGGNKISLITLTPAGAEPHEFEPSSRDIALLEKSSVLIVNGLGLEPWYGNMKENIDSKKTFILVAGEGLGESSRKDPHVWLSPTFMKIMAERIEMSFSKIDPKNKNLYRENLRTITAELNALDADFRKGLAKCEKNEIITSHSAFYYLAKDYGLTEIPIAGLSPDAEPSPKTLGGIVNFAKEHKVKYIFFESLVSPKLAETIANEVGAKTLVLNPLEGLTEKEKTAGENYVSVMRKNLANLQTALSCTKLTP